MIRKMNRKLKLEKILKIIKLYEIYNMCNMKKPRIWSRSWLLRRDKRQLGACSFVQNELCIEDLVSYKNYLRLDNTQFEKLHSLIEHRIKRNDTQFRQCISSRARLIITLRFLATGESYQSLSYSTRIATCTISVFVPEVLSAIYEELKDEYLKCPSTVIEWQNVAKDFYAKWNVPNTIGAMDGKHIVFRAPRSAGSHFYNYKGTHSIVLLAIVDANYQFLYIDVGTNGRVSDGGVYNECDFALELNRCTLNLPDDKPLPGMQYPVPYVILADAAFPLQNHILKPYPFKNMSKEERIFNYRLSRGRRVVENVFGILANRFRILLNPINLSSDKVVLITQACCTLHNFIKREQPYEILSQVDKELDNGKFQNGSWRNQGNELTSSNFRRGRPNNSSLRIRDEFKTFFNGCGRVAWQDDMI